MNDWNNRKKGSVSRNEEFNNKVKVNKEQRRKGFEEDRRSIDDTFDRFEVNGILNDTNSTLHKEQLLIIMFIRCGLESEQTSKTKVERMEANYWWIDISNKHRYKQTFQQT